MKKEIYRLNMQVEDLKQEVTPQITWLFFVNDEVIMSPDLSELIYHYYFEN